MPTNAAPTKFDEAAADAKFRDFCVAVEEFISDAIFNSPTQTLHQQEIGRRLVEKYGEGENASPHLGRMFDKKSIVAGGMGNNFIRLSDDGLTAKLVALSKGKANSNQEA